MESKLVKILLVEDSPKVSELLQQALLEVKSDQFELTRVSQLDEALKYLDKEHFDVILLDVSLPGFETFIKIRSQIIKVPIVVLTELENEELALRAVQEGAQDYLIKQHVNGIVIARVINYAIERSRLLEELRALSLRDELTGLYNRRGFLVLTEQQMKLSARIKKKAMLLYIDINGMKWINDTLGHHEGDRALKTTARILKESFREADIIARIGGDEFVVFAMETKGESIKMLTTRLRNNLDSHNARENHRYDLAVSIGTARCDPQYPCSIDELLGRADKLMYEEKQHKMNS